MNVLELVKKFFAAPFNRYLVAALLVLGLVALIFVSEAPVPDAKKESFIHFFYLPTCPHCAEQKPFNALMEKNYSIKIVAHDVSTDEDREVFLKAQAQRGFPGVVPITLVGNRTFVGFDLSIAKKIEAAILECKATNCKPILFEERKEEEWRAARAAQAQQNNETFMVTLPFLGEQDLRKYSLPALSVTLGIVDGFNPCAMWVLVYLIALVAGIGSKRRMFFVVGTFVFASGMFYFLLMTAWLNTFLFIGYVRPVTVVLGMVALGGGVLSLKTYVETRNKLVCKMESPEEKEKTMKWARELLSSPLTWATLVSIVSLAFFVNVIEFVCSSAIPAIFTQILALSNLSAFEYYAHILLYDFFYMLDDIVIFGLAVFAVSRTMGEKYAVYNKLIGGALLSLLGLVLLFVPNLLR